MNRSTNPKLTLQTLLVLALLTSALNSTAARRDALQVAVDRVIAEVKPALVRIHVVSTSYREGREVKYVSAGSGIIITPEGHVITNHHVAGHATRLVCTLANREEVEAELIGTDALTDIAVIKLQPEKPTIFPFARFGDSDKARVGDHVMAMGSPMALSQSVTLGIISNTEMVMPRKMRFGNFRLDGEDVGSHVRWIAHDAVIYGGNSGGALVNLDGEIIGINEISFGLGGAIPGNLAEKTARALMEHGKVRRAWIGVTVQPLLRRGERNRGILVAGTIEGSPADEVGLQSGDIILRLGGQEVDVRFDEQLPDFNLLVSNLKIAEPTEVLVQREGDLITLQITASEREQVRHKQHELKPWGITARNLSYVMAKELKRDRLDGALVTSVRPGGPAGDAKPAITRGDIIVSIGGKSIENVESLIARTGELTRGATKPVPVLVGFERKTSALLTAVEVGIRDMNDPGLEVKKAWLPVDTQVITRDIAQLMNNPELTGFRVTQVYGADTSGSDSLQLGDLIRSVDNEKLTASAPEHYEELPMLIRSYKVGTTVELSVVRDGQEIVVPVELIRSPKLDREMKKYRDEDFEFTVRNVTFFDKADERWGDETHGVLVEEVKPGGWAALGLLNVGDLIMDIQGIPIQDVADLEDTMKEIVSEKPSAVVLKVLRGIYTLFIEVEPKWSAN